MLGCLFNSIFFHQHISARRTIHMLNVQWQRSPGAFLDGAWHIPEMSKIVLTHCLCARVLHTWMSGISLRTDSRTCWFYYHLTSLRIGFRTNFIDFGHFDFWYKFRIYILVPYSPEEFSWGWRSRSWILLGQFPCDTKTSMFIFMRRHKHTRTHTNWIRFGAFPQPNCHIHFSFNWAVFAIGRCM